MDDGVGCPWQFWALKLARLRWQECWGPYIPLPRVVVRSGCVPRASSSSRAWSQSFSWSPLLCQSPPGAGQLPPEADLASAARTNLSWTITCSSWNVMFPVAAEGMDWCDPFRPHRTPGLCFEDLSTLNSCYHKWRNYKLKHSTVNRADLRQLGS